MNLSIIIPSYNELENLQVLLPQLKTELTNTKINYEILIIDTVQGCEETRNICSTYLNIKYINRSPSNSYGDAVRTGINKSNGDFLIFMDADGSHSPSFVKTLYEKRNNADIVIASRYIDGGKTENGLILIFMSFVVNKLYSLVLNLNIKDVSNSFKLYKSNYVKNLILKCANFDIVEEILYNCKVNYPTIKILEIPYTFKKRMYGETKRNLLIFIFTFILTLIKLRFSKKTIKY
jgi:dolichol-phosphate mannosyltransferase